MIDLENLRALLEEGQRLQQELKPLSDTLSREFEGLEDDLGRLDYRVEASVPAPDEDHPKRVFGWRRYSKVWRFVFEDGEIGRGRLLINGSQAEKMKAIDLLPELLVEIIGQQRANVGRVRLAMERAKLLSEILGQYVKKMEEMDAESR